VPFESGFSEEQPAIIMIMILKINSTVILFFMVFLINLALIVSLKAIII